MPAAHASTMGSPARDRSLPAGSLHVVIDLNRCQGYAQCCFLAPTVFQLHGEEALWYDPAPEEAQVKQVLRAAAACPVQAIVVEGRGATIGRHSEAPDA